MSQHLSRLGWGIMGTPKGRQQVDCGVNQQLKVSFDLNQELGGCLPHPTKANGEALYVVSSKTVGQYWQVGVAEYHSIFEQGQTRAGTYFGAYLNVLGAVFAADKAKQLLSTLRNLNVFQATQFINAQTCAYVQSIHGQNVPTPQDQLNELAEALQPLPEDDLKVQKEALYLPCGAGQAVETLAFILKNHLYLYYKEIFFSESGYISEQMRKKKMDYGLENVFSFIERYKQRVAELRNDNLKTRQELSKVKNDQDTIITQQVKQKEQVIAQQFNSQKQGYEHQIQQNNQQIQNLNNELQRANVLAAIGHSAVEAVANAPVDLVQSDLSQFKSRGYEQKLSEIQVSLNGLKAEVIRQQQAWQQRQPEIVETNNVKPYQILTGVFAAVAILCLGLAVWLSRSEPSTEKITSSQPYKTLVSEKLNLETQNSTLLTEKENLAKKMSGKPAPSKEEIEKELIKRICQDKDSKKLGKLDGKKLCEEIK